MNKEQLYTMHWTQIYTEWCDYVDQEILEISDFAEAKQVIADIKAKR